MSWTITPNWYDAGDPDAVAYISAVNAADAANGQSGGLEIGVRLAIDKFVVGCKADGIWPALKASCILAGARTLAGALVPLAGTAPTNNNFVSGDYNRKTGLVGNGTSKHLNTNRPNNADPQNSSHRAVYVSTAHTSGNANFPSYIGVEGSVTQINRDQNNGQLYARINASTFSLIGSGSSTGFAGISRDSSTAWSGRVGAATTTYNQSSTGTSASNTYVLANNNAGAANNYSNARLAFYSIGESIDLAKLDARVSALITAFGTAIP